MRRAPWLLALPAVFLLLFFFRPVWVVLQAGFDTEAWQWILGPFVTSRLRGALLQALLSVLATLALAIPLAWLHHHYKIQWNRGLLAIHAAPFVLPVFVIIFGIQAVTQSTSLSPLVAIVLAHAYYNYGFAARLIHATLQRRPRTMEAAAATLGAPPKAAFFHTTFPLLLPNLVAISLLVFLFAFSSFGVVLYLGQGEYSTLETLMYSVLRGAFARPERAAALGIVQLAINVALLAAYTFLLRKQQWKDERQPTQSTQWASPAAMLAVALSLVPACLVLVQGFQVDGSWSLEPWRALLQANHPSHLAGFHLPSALGLSAMYALVSASLAVLLTFSLAYGARTMPRAKRLADALAALPLGTSSLLIGFGYVLTFGVSGFLNVWTGRALIISVHALISFPFTARVLLPAIAQLNQRTEAAARTLGAPPWSVWWHVHMPALRGPFLVALGFAVAMSLGDFGASLLLQNAENRSLSVWINAHGGANGFDPLLRAQAVALSGLLMVLATAAYVIVERGRHA